MEAHSSSWTPHLQEALPDSLFHPQAGARLNSNTAPWWAEATQDFINISNVPCTLLVHSQDFLPFRTVPGRWGGVSPSSSTSGVWRSGSCGYLGPLHTPLSRPQIDLYAGALFVHICLGWNFYLSTILMLAVTALYTIAGTAPAGGRCGLWTCPGTRAVGGGQGATPSHSLGPGQFVSGTWASAAGSAGLAAASTAHPPVQGQGTSMWNSCPSRSSAHLPVPPPSRPGPLQLSRLHLQGAWPL